MQAKRYDGAAFDIQNQKPIMPMEDVQSTSIKMEQQIPKAPIYLPYYQGYLGYGQTQFDRFDRSIPYGYVYNPQTNAYVH